MRKHRIGMALGLLALAPLAGMAQTLTPSQDAYYVPGNGTNFGTAATITVGSSGSVGLVQFDLSTLPAGITAGQVQKATLTLFLDRVGAGGTVNLNTVASSWGEVTVNGIAAPASGSVVAAAVPAATANTYLSVDATAAVQGWITSPVTNNGFLITGAGGTSVQFDSKENLNTSHPATLTIVLAAAGPAGAPGANGRTLLSGSTAPANSQGADGDFYLQSPAMCMWGPKAQGVWPAVCTSLIGPSAPLAHVEEGDIAAQFTEHQFSTPFPTPPQCAITCIPAPGADYLRCDGAPNPFYDLLYLIATRTSIQITFANPGAILVGPLGRLGWRCY